MHLYNIAVSRELDNKVGQSVMSASSITTIPRHVTTGHVTDRARPDLGDATRWTDSLRGSTLRPIKTFHDLSHSMVLSTSRVAPFFVESLVFRLDPRRVENG